MDDQFVSISRRIASETQKTIRDELVAERTLIQIRMGRSIDARAALRELRNEYGKASVPRMSVWLLILDGLTHYFEALHRDAGDRLRRALAISASCGFPDLQAIAAAWLTHVYFNESSYEKMLNAMLICAKTVRPSQSATVCRLAIVVADAHQYSGNWHDARTWYEIARKYALRAGDRESIGAIIYNRMAIGTARMRVEPIIGIKRLGSYRSLVVEATSAANFHSALAIESLPDALTLCTARAYFSESRFTEATQIYESILSREWETICRLNRDSLYLELALCKAYLGDVAETTIALGKSNFSSYSELDPDDRLFYQTYHIWLLRKYCESSVTTEMEVERQRSVERYLSEVESLTRGVDSVMDSLNALFLRLESLPEGSNG